jgi:hypothetical protein
LPKSLLTLYECLFKSIISFHNEDALIGVNNLKA